MCPFSQSPDTTRVLNFARKSQQYGIQVNPFAPVGTLTAFSIPASTQTEGESIWPSVRIRTGLSRLQWFIPNEDRLAVRFTPFLVFINALTEPGIAVLYKVQDLILVIKRAYSRSFHCHSALWMVYRSEVTVSDVPLDSM